MATNLAASYLVSKIKTASPAELTLMLFDGAVKYCNIAVEALEKNDYQKSNENLKKAQNIIVELRCTLDFKYTVAQSFDDVYEYIQYRLIETNTQKNTVPLQEALGYIKEMRDTWKQVMRLNKIYVA